MEMILTFTKFLDGHMELKLWLHVVVSRVSATLPGRGGTGKKSEENNKKAGQEERRLGANEEGQTGARGLSSTF